MINKNIEFIFSVLEKNFDGGATELNYSTDFQLLVAVMLSAQTTDKQVNKTTLHFFDTIKYPKDLVAIGLEKFENLIKSVNFYKNKAKHIYNTAQILLNDYNSEIPNDMILLQKMPGIGEKTAKVVVHVLYDEPTIAVDTHVHRVTNRLGIVNTKMPLQTSKLLENIIPIQYKHLAHRTLIYFGRYHCKAKKPLCESCWFKNICKYYKKNFRD